ncbi:MAG TPA: hypothetical protein VIK73_09140 [Limnochordales bacterium]
MMDLLVALRWELFKARRLRMLWVLLGLLVLLLVLSAGISYQAYQDVRRYARVEIAEAATADRPARALRQEVLAAALRANLELPSAYGGISGVLFFPGFVLISIAGATLVANEFGWGTMQRLLGRGRRRWVMVGAKLGLVAILAAVGVVVGLAAGTAIASLTSWRLGSLDGSVFGDAETWRSLGVVAVRLWAVLTVYGLAAAAAGFAWQNPGVAVGGALVYYFVEALVSGLIVQSRGWLSELRPYLLGNVTRALVVNDNPFLVSLAVLRETGGEAAARVLDPGAAWAVLAVYGAAFVALSLVLVRRDLSV